VFQAVQHGASWLVKTPFNPMINVQFHVIDNAPVREEDGITRDRKIVKIRPVRTDVVTYPA
jgi:hypothetical protein